MEPSTDDFMAVVACVARERSGNFAVVLGREDRERLGVLPMQPVRPSLNPLVIGPPRR